ncbi:MAG: DUF4136 domain-containing protein [Pseudomonadales bacterium]
MTPLTRTGLALGLLILAGCASTPEVGVDHNPAYDFAGKTRFAVLRPEAAIAAIGGRGTPVMDDLMANRLTRTIEGSLRARGYTIVPADQADMIVTFLVTTRDQTDVQAYNTGFGYRRCWDPRFCTGWANPEITIRQYTVGTLFIDFIDPATGSLQWRGTTSKRLPSKPPSQEKRDETASEVVNAIIDQFPPGHAPAS